MLKNIKNFLNQPYPYYYEGRFLWIFSFTLSTMALFFIYFFKPFNVILSEHKFNYFIISFIHAFAAFLIIIIQGLFSKILIKNKDFWTVKKEVTYLILLLLFIGIAQFLIRDIIYTNPNNWSIHILYIEIRNTFLVGILFIIILVPLNYQKLLAFNKLNSQSIQLPDSISSSPATIISIRTLVKEEAFQMDVSDFLFAKSDGNYMELYFFVNESEYSVLKRISLKDFYKQLSSFPWILKTHRSYLLNINYIKEIKGNAQGYKIYLHDCQLTVPVSRNNISQFELKIKALT